MTSYLILIAATIYLVMSIYNRRLGLYILIALLPSYVLRFNIGQFWGFAIPTTFLEIMVLVSIFLAIFDLVRGHFLKSGVKTKACIEHENIKKISPALLIFIFIFLLGATINIFVATDILKALGIWRAFYLEPVLVFFIFILRFQTPLHWKNAFFSLALSAFGVSALAVYQSFTGWMIFNPFWADAETRRVTSVFGFPNGVGLYLAPIVSACIALFFLLPGPRVSPEGHCSKKSICRVFYIVVALSGLYSIIEARSTGAIIAIIGSIFAALIIYKKTRLYTLGFLTVCAIFIFAGLIFTPGYTKTILPQSAADEILMRNLSGRIRVQMWAETIEFIKQNPIFGAGLASFQKKIVPYHVMPVEIFHHPHNILLNFWVETGIVGLVGFMGIILTFMHLVLLALRRNSDCKVIMRAAGLSMLAILIHGLVDTPYIKNDLSILFWLLIAAAAANGQ